MKQKLIFLDIDGTLTPPGGYEPPESALKVIRRARERGHKVFLSSGRNYCMIEPLLKYGFDGGITSCGGYVFTNDKVLYDHPMTEEQKNGVMASFAENDVFLTIEGQYASYRDYPAEHLLARYPDTNSHLHNMIKGVWDDLGPTDISEYDGSPIYKMVFVCTDVAQIRDAEERFGDGLHFVVHDFSEPDCHFGEVLNRKFNKGSGVYLIADALGVDIADTIGFGDSMIDIEMTEAVGTSVCMGNGSPKLKEMSDLICPAADEDGMEWAFHKLGLV